MNITRTRLTGAASLITAVAVGLSSGCQGEKREAPAKVPEVSLANLQTAYEVSMKRRKMYGLFVERAKKDRLAGAARLYGALAASEGVQAESHAELLGRHGRTVEPFEYDSIVVGNTLQTLKMALSSEEIECNAMYPNLVRSATLEGYPPGVAQFGTMQAIEERHIELVQHALAKEGKLGAAEYFVCSICGYVLTSSRTEECPVDRTTKDRFISVL